MDTYVDERDYELLSRDKYTFSVLSRIMGEKTMHDRLNAK